MSQALTWLTLWGNLHLRADCFIFQNKQVSDFRFSFVLSHVSRNVHAIPDIFTRGSFVTPPLVFQYLRACGLPRESCSLHETRRITRRPKRRRRKKKCFYRVKLLRDCGIRNSSCQAWRKVLAFVFLFSTHTQQLTWHRMISFTDVRYRCTNVGAYIRYRCRWVVRPCHTLH